MYVKYIETKLVKPGHQNTLAEGRTNLRKIDDLLY